MTEPSEHKFDECVDYAISKFYEVLRERSGSQTAAISDPTKAKPPPKPFVPPERIGPYKKPQPMSDQHEPNSATAP